MADIINVRESNFRTAVEAADASVLVEFYADWDGTSQMILKELEQLAYEENGVTVAKINVDENNNLAERFNVSSLPCTILFVKGEPEKTINGFRTKQQLQALINS